MKNIFLSWLNGVLAERQVSKMPKTFEVATSCGFRV
jgi:hypothetical protein